jgi:aspartyl-tRNA(Asn)/glutamyl-tRNA(Gln) amidotransferase subunit A
MTDIHQKSILELSTMLENKDVSSVELLNYFYTRVKKYDKKINSIVCDTYDFALNQAQKADEVIQKQPSKKNHMTGIPIGIKDIFCTEGIKTTCCSNMLKDFISPYNATLIEKLNAQNAVMIAKTNMDEFAMGGANINSYFGPCKNPWNLSHSPGGSSGGSAAIVASGMAPCSIGTDTGGSIRQPAAFCGVSGIKPTYGRVSRWGMIAFASSLDQGGPIAKSAEDLAIILESISGHDEKDSTSSTMPVPNYIDEINNPIKGLTIGLPEECFTEDLDPKISNLVMDAVEEFQKLGLKVKKISLPNSVFAVPAYYIIAPSECSSNLARYDAARYGLRVDNPTSLEEMYADSRSHAFGAEVQRRILIGTFALSSGYYDAYYSKAQNVRRLIKYDYIQAFQDVDIIVTPTFPTTAFNLNKKLTPVEMYLADVFTIPANLAGLPSMSIPVGFSSDDLPVGMQLTGCYYKESMLLNVAHSFQKSTTWHQDHPADYK